MLGSFSASNERCYKCVEYVVADAAHCYLGVMNTFTSAARCWALADGCAEHMGINFNAKGQKAMHNE